MVVVVVRWWWWCFYWLFLCTTITTTCSSSGVASAWILPSSASSFRSLSFFSCQTRTKQNPIGLLLGLGSKKNENDDRNEDGLVHYDDFGGQVVGGSSSSSSSGDTVLEERMESLRQEETSQIHAMMQNFELGRWNVRGFSLDPYNDAALKTEQDTDPKIHVCCLAVAATSPQQDTSWDDYLQLLLQQKEEEEEEEEDPLGFIWVGRTDGSVVCVALGTAHWTAFRSRLVIADEQDNTTTNVADNTVVRVTSQLVPDQENDPQKQAFQNTAATARPFSIVYQLPKLSASSPIQALLPVDQYLFTVHADSTDIQPWHFHQTTMTTADNDSKERSLLQMVPTQHVLTGVHGAHAKLVCLETVTLSKDSSTTSSSSATRTVLVSVASDATCAVWEIQTAPGPQPLVAWKATIPSANDDDDNNMNDRSVTSATVGNGQVFIGTSQGYVLAYDVQDLMLQQQAASSSSSNHVFPPHGHWKVTSDDAAITAMACSAAATPTTTQQETPSSSNAAATVVMTGTARGQVQQWQVWPRYMNEGSSQNQQQQQQRLRLEHWPKMPNQRLPNRLAHVFQDRVRDSDDAVTVILPLAAPTPSTSTSSTTPAADTVLCAYRRGSLRAWNAVTGQRRYDMEGFEQLSSLCWLPEGGWLITNGMTKYVCVHDFAATAGADEEDEEDEDEDGQGFWDIKVQES